MIPLSSSDPPNLHAGLGLDDSARRLLWPGTIEELRRLGFEPQGQIAQGATSVVISCKERSTGRTLVVKACYDPTNNVALELFQRERQILASDHPLGDVLPHYYGGVDQPGPPSPGSEPCQPFLLLESINGRRICDYIAEAREFPLWHKVQLCAALARAVQRMHDANLVHGDISSNNVLVCRGDRVRLIDVGQGGRLTRGYRSLHSVSGQAGTGGFSPASLLARHERPSQSTDLRQCAAVVFHALTGELAGSDPEQKGASRQTSVLARQAIPRPLAQIVVRGLRDRDSRIPEDEADPRLYQSAGAFADDLERWCASQGPNGRHTRRMIPPALAFAVVASLLGLSWGLWPDGRREDAARQVAPLLSRCAVLPNREHPAIAALLRQERELSRSAESMRASGDRAAAQLLNEQRIQLLEQVVEISDDLIWMAPLRENLTFVLTESPWIESAPTIARAVTTLRDESEQLRRLLEQGVTREAGSRIISFHRRLAEATRENTEARPVLDLRQELETLLSLLPPRVADHPGRTGWEERQSVAEQAWSAGEWAVARQMFGQLCLDLVSWMESELTSEEQQSLREASVAAMGKLRQQLVQFGDQNLQLESRVVSLNRQIQELTAEALQKQRDLEQRLTAVEAERAKLEGDGKTIRNENERLHTELKSTRDDLQSQRKLRQVADRNLAEWKRHAVESDRLLQELRSALGSRIDGLPVHAGPPMSTMQEGTEAGERLVLDCGENKLPFRWCPPGQFRMGSPLTEPGRESNEDEVDVTLTSGFWMMETEVTQSMWVAVMGNERQQNWEQQYGLGDNYPAYRIAWDEIQQFCARLTAKLREQGKLPRGWRLEVPTEAQWEYACRAGGTERFCFGDNEGDLQRFAWYGDNAGGTNHPVATREPNRWGLHDLHGSVWEWTQNSYDKQLLGGIDPRGASEGTSRVRRGGSWIAGSASCRSATRNGFTPRWSDYLGFRPCLRVAPESPADSGEEASISDVSPTQDPGERGEGASAPAEETPIQPEAVEQLSPEPASTKREPHERTILLSSSDGRVEFTWGGPGRLRVERFTGLQPGSLSVVSATGILSQNGLPWAILMKLKMGVFAGVAWVGWSLRGWFQKKVRPGRSRG
ncbi:MAG TPA: hypothetical protein DDY91_04750 [Planctomycetaceae bacterium]|nr:hypothetical protein [Planctomycetaceae bacterium]